MSGAVERETAKDMIVRYSPGAKRITVGADKGFDTADFVSDMRDFNVTPHVAQNTTNRLSAIDGLARSATADTRSASRNANGSRSHSGGARPSADWRGQCCVA